jgi:hypothetical protein
LPAPEKLTLLALYGAHNAARIYVELIANVVW